jgi:dephospho-CoA kinase
MGEPLKFLKVGLTGGIASGKSAVARAFSEEGIPVIDADALVRELSAPGGKAHDEIVRQFGTADRKLLRERVFKSPDERKLLEGILHPWVARESAERMAQLQAQGAPGVIYEAALLIEAGRAGDFDEVILVLAPGQQRIERLKQRDGITDEVAAAILSAQMEDAERLKWATQVVRNESSMSELRRQVRDLKKKLFF